jgi:hypothetical protein
MGDVQANQSGVETGSGSESPGAGSVACNGSDALSDRSVAPAPAVQAVESPATAAAGNVVELKSAAAPAGMPKAEPFTVQGFKGDSCKLDVAKSDASKSDASKPDASKADVAKADVAKPDISRPDVAKGDVQQAGLPGADALDAVAVKPGASGADKPGTDGVRAAAARRPGELQIMSAGERAWAHGGDHGESGPQAPTPDLDSPARGRRYAAFAAMLALAVIAGAAGGALATLSLSHAIQTADAAAPTPATLETLGRIDAEITALKAGVERSSTAGLTQVNKTGDRLERIEKAQAEATTKLARLGETIDKLRAASSAAAPVATVAAKEVTGTVTSPAGAQAMPTPQLQASPATTPAAAAPTTAGNAPATAVGRLPTVEGWVLREAGRGSALIEGRSGLYEVFAGDPVPGLGRVDAIRKQDGRWVVVTSKGLIVAR